MNNALAILLILPLAGTGRPAATQRAGITFTTIFSADTKSGRVEIRRAAHETPDPEAYFWYYSISIKPIGRHDKEHGGPIEAKTGDFADMITWDEPRWLDVACDGKHIAVLYNQYDCCRLLMFTEGAQGQFIDNLPEMWFVTKEGSVSSSAVKGEVSFNKTGTVDVSLTLRNSSERTFRLVKGEREFYWRQMSGPPHMEMPHFKLKR